MKTQSFHANGKLLLTGEYFILDGAKSLALPSKLGQSLTICHKESLLQKKKILLWQSYDVDGSLWFECQFSLFDFFILQTTDNKIASNLQNILYEIRKINANFLPPTTTENNSILAKTHLTFHRLWGLGTSSTLISLLAQWAMIDPFLLLENTMGGSGYDIACAAAYCPIVYQRQGRSLSPIIQKSTFNPPFLKNLYFIYLDKKQNSKDGIAHYRQKEYKENLILQLNIITEKIENCTQLTEFESLIENHEQIIANFLNIQTAKNLYFSDYWGAIKSLGAWGGDFILATSDKSKEETLCYFRNKGFVTFLPNENLYF